MWVGLDNPWDQMDRALFYASSHIIIGNGARAPFWDSPWINGVAPLDLAPLIFDISSRKKWKVREAMHGDAWLEKIRLPMDWTMEHITQIVTLWARSRYIHLLDGIQDDIIWKHTTSGRYSATSAYKAQFLGATRSPMGQTIWKVWAPPKVKFFAWLATQNRLWTADRLHIRSWIGAYCPFVPKCKNH